MLKPGDRIVAISHANGTKVYSYGNGVFLGTFVRPKQVTVIRTAKLDSGEIINDEQCFFSPPEAISGEEVELIPLAK